MADRANFHPSTQLDDLLESLISADDGGLKLDTLLAYAVAGADLRTETLRDVMTEGSFSMEVAGELLDGRPPPFTRALDASLPGENIVLATYSDKRGQWAAVQREADGREFVSWAGTEALARRAAALQAISARQAKPAEDEYVTVASLLTDAKAPELKAVEPAPMEPVVEKTLRAARPDAPNWQIKF